jgi:cellulose synthase/poly-beta-1,6-N-acetylglucosamine synthase-like glycosyltransferase
LLKACTSFNSPEHEVIVIDDSDDKKTRKKLDPWREHPLVKIIQRDSRKGWKGGALNAALEKVNPKSTHVLIFDADFIPPSNIVSRFINKFRDKETVAVQGYQKHDLNADENWVTKGVRVWHSVYNIIELNGKKTLNLFNPLTGGAFMICTEVLKKLKFEEVTDEDWNLTVRMYEKGFKINYDPELVASGECPNTFKKFIKQQARWAEGHTRTFRQHFWKIIKNTNLSIREKLDYVITGYCFLHSVMVTLLLGALLIVQIFPSSTFPIYLTQLQAILLIISIPAALFASAIALYLEKAKKDIRKIGYAWLLNFLILPVLAYSSLKGLFTNQGYFNRTHKTGKIINK